MLSPYHPIRKRRAATPIDAVFDQWQENMAKGRKEPPTLSHLHLMMLLFMRL